jgi:hypothetical protein
MVQLFLSLNQMRLTSGVMMTFWRISAFADFPAAVLFPAIPSPLIFARALF